MLVKSLLSEKIKELLQKSIHSELFASNFYKHAANNMQRLGFFGAQKFFLKESENEITHYQKIVDYLNDMGDMANIPSLEPFTERPDSISQALNKSYEVELGLMNKYQEFYKIAEEMEDCITSQFVLQFLQIQRESVGEYGDLISRYNKIVGMAEILKFDDELGKL
jgi:ferritin